MDTALRFIVATACWASTRGSGGAPAGGCANQIRKTGATTPNAAPGRVHS